VPYVRIPYEIINSPDHQALALQAARESIVLLKNQGNFLPLRKDLDAIAVVGPNANDLLSLLGNYSGTPTRAIKPLRGYPKQGLALDGGIPRPRLRLLTALPLCRSFRLHTCVRWRPVRAKVGYRYFRGESLFPFGHGLSCTTF